LEKIGTSENRECTMQSREGDEECQHELIALILRFSL
jgi:hypothetical protein